MVAKIAIINTSTRAVRIGPSVAAMVKDVYTPPAKAAGHELTVLDVKDYNLPIFDETILPAMVPYKGEFAHEHSRNWTAAIEKFDAYVLISPEYNFGIPASTKNAIDYLYNAWIGKPIIAVTYGVMGGKSASDALKAILTGMKLRLAETRPTLAFKNGQAELPHVVGGVLPDEVVEFWKSQSEDLDKAYAEMTALLLAPKEEEKKE